MEINSKMYMAPPVNRDIAGIAITTSIALSTIAQALSESGETSNRLKTTHLVLKNVL